MNKNLISIALVAVLATMAVSCQKENIMEPGSTETTIASVRTVSYYIDGVKNEATFYSESDWDAFINRVMDLTDQGHEIYIVGNNISGVATKDTQTKTSADKEEITEWAKEKHDEDYDVKIKKNQDGTYTATAIK